MGKLLPSYKKAIIDEVIDNIASNTSQYYAFAANPIEIVGTVPPVTGDDYSTLFVNDWQMLFGKKIANNDVYPIVEKNIWVSNTVYDRYDNTSNTLYTNNNFYVICSPAIPGGSYHVYKCIDNANNAVSTVDPSSIGTPTQATTFQTGDNYKWRYLTSISSQDYDDFATSEYAPIYANSTIASGAKNYAGVEVVVIANSGSGYDSYTSGIVQGNPNATVIQIENNSSGDNQFYVNNGIYIYNAIAATSQLRTVVDYVANTSGKWVYIDEPANTTNITPAVTQYLITPKVSFTSDGASQPQAYSTINTTSNSIGSVIILDSGSDISWANVVIQSNTNYGTGANLYAIVPPPGGHGADPVTELNVKGMAFHFVFANTESNTIITSNTVYNKIGLLKNPYILTANNEKGGRYSSNTFSHLLEANLSPSHTFTVGETVTGQNSGAVGTVVYSNSSYVYLTGDKHFEDGEYVANAAGSVVTTIAIQTLGDVYTKDMKPFYVQNINNVNRSNTQTESFKLIIQV